MYCKRNFGSWSIILRCNSIVEEIFLISIEISRSYKTRAMLIKNLSNGVDNIWVTTKTLCTYLNKFKSTLLLVQTIFHSPSLPAPHRFLMANWQLLMLKKLFLSTLFFQTICICGDINFIMDTLNWNLNLIL